MPVVARSAGCPAPLPIGATTGCPATVPTPARSGRLPDRRLRSRAQVRLPGPRPGPRTGCPARGPDAVHADPVARANRRGAIGSPPLGSSWGAPVTRRPVAPPLAAPGHPDARRRGAVASRPARSRFHLVDRTRLRSSEARRLPSNDSVARSRLACAPRYEPYLREHKTPGQGQFRKTQGYPRTNAQIPRVHRFVHRAITGLSPAHLLFIPSSRATRRLTD